MTHDFIPATPYARLVAGEKGADLRLAAPTGVHGAVRAQDVLAVAGKARPAAATPLARRMAAEFGVDLGLLAGGGCGGKITKDDVLAAWVARSVAPTAPPPDERRVKLGGVRRVVAQRMSRAHAEIPPVTHVVKTDVTALAAARERLNARGGKKYSLNDFLLLATVRALLEHRNLLVSMDGDEIVHKERVNIGMAVAVEAGLVVPVILDADRLTLDALSGRARDLAERARANRLAPDEFRGNTFTVTNLGMYDVELFTPIINQPDAAILGFGAVAEELALQNGAVAARKFMRTCLTYDHRLLDGASAAAFQKTVKRLLENPIELAL